MVIFAFNASCMAFCLWIERGMWCGFEVFWSVLKVMLTLANFRALMEVGGWCWIALRSYLVLSANLTF